jgi:hypothetical protein
MVVEKLRKVFGKNPEDMADIELASRVGELFDKVYHATKKHKMEDVLDLEEARFYLRKRGWKEHVELLLEPPDTPEMKADETE